MTDATPEELKAALANWRDKEFATLIVVAVQLAVERHPEELRKALAKVFDLSGLEDYSKRIMAVATSAQQYAMQANELCQQVSKEVEELEKRHDALLNDQPQVQETRK